MLPHFTPHFTVYAMDRRGRGSSGDSPTYQFEREFEDVASLVESIGESVSLLGYSLGAISALEAARRVGNLHKLVVFEPPIPTAATQSFFTYGGLVERLEEMLAQGDYEGVYVTFMRDVVRNPPEAIEVMRTKPSWSARVASAPLIVRDMVAVAAYKLNAGQFAKLTVPTLLLMGSETTGQNAGGIEILAKTLPNSRVMKLPGQQHLAMFTAPELFGQEVLKFLLA
ncbi:MAG: hypothetical protein NVS4B8_29440 [Herpetosiphon sp.]